MGEALATWVTGLRREVVRARSLARGVPIDAKRRWEIASSTPFEDGSVTRRAQDLARLLGHGVGAIEAAYGPSIAPLSDTLIERAAPELPTPCLGGVIAPIFGQAAAVAPRSPRPDKTTACLFP